MALRQCLYVSTAPSLSRDEVDAILASSEKNNPARGITGLLLYNGRNFLQLLEGDEVELLDLIVRLNHDPRHSGISFLYRGDIAERSCPDWAMKRVLIAEPVEDRKRLLEAELPKKMDPEIRRIIVNFAVLN